MGLMIIVAIALHTIIILGITFSGSDLPDESKVTPRIEVTLVNTRSEIVPDKADYLAQANQEGGGNTQEKIRPETLFAPLIPKDVINITAPTPPSVDQPREQKASRKEFMSQETSTSKIVTDVAPVKKSDTKSKTAAELVSQSKNIASLEVELGESMRAYSQLPRKKYITAQTKEYKYATYMESWRRKVEKIGNLNFPEEAKRRNLKGSLILDVVINADGTIRSINVSKSSNHKLLDDAAVAIVRLAAPFAPLSPAILKETDVLHITRTWEFMGGDLTSSQ
ncbi:MAG: TonB family protein [Gammaproteobacteria bacterium]|nr:TonB family protein [Gammaproteobacteria bacterium]